jgi:hypothetical protein
MSKPFNIESYQTKKKEKNLKRLVERYYGKQALLATWEEQNPGEVKYRNELKRQIQGYKRDILTRTGEEPLG